MKINNINILLSLLALGSNPRQATVNAANLRGLLQIQLPGTGGSGTPPVIFESIAPVDNPSPAPEPTTPVTLVPIKTKAPTASPTLPPTREATPAPTPCRLVTDADLCGTTEMQNGNYCGYETVPCDLPYGCKEASTCAVPNTCCPP